MPRQVKTAEEKKLTRQEQRRRYIANAETLNRKREYDRLQKQAKRQQEKLLRQDPLALLATVVVQRELSEEGTEGPNIMIPSEDGQILEEHRTEPDESLILQPLMNDELNDEFVPHGDYQQLEEDYRSLNYEGSGDEGWGNNSEQENSKIFIFEGSTNSSSDET